MQVLQSFSDIGVYSELGQIFIEASLLIVFCYFDLDLDLDIPQNTWENSDEFGSAEAQLCSSSISFLFRIVMLIIFTNWVTDNHLAVYDIQRN
jgi:hypothetical protein